MKGRPKVNIKDRRVKTCVRVKPETLKWYKEKKISMGQTLEDNKYAKCKHCKHWVVAAHVTENLELNSVECCELMLMKCKYEPKV